MLRSDAVALRAVCLALAVQVAAAGPPGPVVVVGIDSATWRVIDPLVAAGELPTFAMLRDEGVSGELHTLVPTFSPTIWTSMMTGVVPVLHGIQTPAPPGEMPQTSDCRRVAAIWDMATEHCLRSHVLNLWCTWPAEPILGSVVSERTAWTLPGTVSPDALLPFVKRFLPEPARSRVRTLSHSPAEREVGLAELALALQAVDPVSFVMLYFRELDIVQHRAWSTWPPRGPQGRVTPGTAAIASRHVGRCAAPWHERNGARLKGARLSPVRRSPEGVRRDAPSSASPGPACSRSHAAMTGRFSLRLCAYHARIRIHTVPDHAP